MDKKQETLQGLEIDEHLVESIAQRIRSTGERNTYTISEIVKMPDVRVNAASIRRHIDNYMKGKRDKRQLRAIKKGKVWVVKKADLEEYLY